MTIIPAKFVQTKTLIRVREIVRFCEKISQPTPLAGAPLSAALVGPPPVRGGAGLLPAQHSGGGGQQRGGSGHGPLHSLLLQASASCRLPSVGLDIFIWQYCCCGSLQTTFNCHFKQRNFDNVGNDHQFVWFWHVMVINKARIKLA